MTALFWLMTNLKVLLIRICLLAYLLDYSTALRVAGIDSGCQWACVSDKLAGLHVLWGRFPKGERRPPKKAFASQDICTEAPSAWGALPPHGLLPSGKPSLTLVLVLLLPAPPHLGCLKLLGSFPHSTFHHFKPSPLPGYLSTDLLPWI